MINTGEKETLYIVLYGNVHTKYSVFLLDETIFLCYNRFDFLRKERKKMNVIKRDGRVTAYDRNKILVAIRKANIEVEDYDKLSDEKIESIVESIESLKREQMHVEEVQDMIEQKLMAYGS